MLLFPHYILVIMSSDTWGWYAYTCYAYIQYNELYSKIAAIYFFLKMKTLFIHIEIKEHLQRRVGLPNQCFILTVIYISLSLTRCREWVSHIDNSGARFRNVGTADDTLDERASSHLCCYFRFRNHHSSLSSWIGDA